MIVRHCFITFDQLGNFSKRSFIVRLQILRGFPDVVVVRQKLIPVFLLLLSYRIVVLPGGSLGRPLQSCNELSCPSLTPGAVSPEGVYTPQLCEVSRPPSLCVW